MSDVVILIIVVYMCFERIYWAIIPKLVPNWYEALKLPNAFMSFWWGLIPLGVAFVIKNKTIKVILIVLGALCAAYSFFEIIQSLTKHDDFQHFKF